MNTIPDEIVERVARAICEAIDDSPNADDAASLNACRSASQAALRVSGWAEMREALEYAMETSAYDDDGWEAAWASDARAALSKAGGK